MSYSGSMTRKIAVGVFVLLFATALLFAAAQDTSNWKRYRNSEYGFEIAYPADWEFDANYEDNYGKPPSGGQRPAYDGETRNLFGLEMDGPTQSHEGGGSFDDGAIIDVRITGTSGSVEDWNITPDRPWYLLHSAATASKKWPSIRTDLRAQSRWFALGPIRANSSRKRAAPIEPFPTGASCSSVGSG